MIYEGGQMETDIDEGLRGVPTDSSDIIATSVKRGSLGKELARRIPTHLLYSHDPPNDPPSDAKILLREHKAELCQRLDRREVLEQHRGAIPL